MKKILFTLAAFAIIFASCTKDMVTPEPEARLMRVTATVQEPADTRATLEEVGTGELKSIRFKWETSDVIQMAFVQGAVKKTANATITSVSEDGRTATFTVFVPEGITGDFTLYAYRSSRFPSYTEGSELLASNPTIAVLPKSPNNYNNQFGEQSHLVSLWDKKDVAYTGGDMPAVSLSFKHLGAMMTLKIKNIGSAATTGMYELGFKSTTNTHWVRNSSGNAMAQFDMASGNYVTGQERLNDILSLKTGNFNAGEEKTRYVWFVPGAYTPGNPLQLIARNATFSIIGSSGSNTKDAGNFVPGKNYVVYVTIAGTSPNYVLKYSNSSFE